MHKLLPRFVFGATKINLDYKFIRIASFNKPSLKLGTFLSQCSAIFCQNEASLGLFLKFGFEKWGELPGVCLMDNEYKDVVILGLKL